MHRALALLVLAASTALAADAPLVREWKVDGVKREGLVVAPESAKSKPSPLVFVFHGHGGTMRNAARGFAIEKQWPEAVVVYLQGLKTPGRLTDPNGTRPGWQHSAGDQDDRDLKFFDAVLASLKKDYKIDSGRVFSTGHSNGGSFTYLLWAERPDVLAAVAPSSAVPARLAGRLKPKPVLHVAGEKDPLVKFEWQKVTMERLRKLNKTEPEGRPWGRYATLYPSKTGTPVVLLIHPGGHQLDREAPAAIAKFFREFDRLKPEP